ncbi:hypothetical protein KAJ87_03540 [Candidatus Pacearchaeota archaeon]|nr:hypothetical protein [Candidatus Pacearchaeota archaeon]
MVKIISKKKSKIVRKRENLEAIAKDLIPNLSIQNPFTEDSFSSSIIEKYKPNIEINVNVKDRILAVDPKKGYEIALKLAKKYEEFTKKRWILKKEYYD